MDDRSSDENVLADVTTEERARYLTWWQKFRMLDLVGWIGICLFLVSVLGSQLHQAKWSVLGLLGFALFLLTRLWLCALSCPCCGATYSGGLITALQRFSFLNKCYGCDLSLAALRELARRGY